MILRKYRAPRYDPKIDEPYKAWIRLLPCIVCWTWELRIFGYHGRVESAHIGARGLSQKCPDRETIPLCIWHHRMGPQSVHALGKGFWSYWRLSRPELIADYNRRFEEENRMPREFTEQEIRRQFLNEARMIVAEWSTNKTCRQNQIAGAVFSILALIDGASPTLPGFLLIPDPHPDDKAYRRDRGENWYPEAAEGIDIAGSLHDEFYNPKGE